MVKEGLLGDAICKETRKEKGGVLCRYLEQEASRQMQESMKRVCTASVGLCLQCRRSMFDLGSGKSPGKQNGYPLQYSCLENSIDKMSLAGYSPWAHKELDTIKQLTLSLLTEFIQILIVPRR